ncbi:hypothetical protein ASPTUDRAFT_41096 [Aspergillus tubingensis CBS 134.48]|uniref:Uncharacterized protein n=1 Tax=Aspergillus tubingensis (strain CBS 134.48) TaxID=767770 RepID=A0A1L9N6S2_ASPTC|nr:hypothetical protein ASPTUDRAFT_41096 [Aspergillus tubingensis CBS 134.48]
MFFLFLFQTGFWLLHCVFVFLFPFIFADHFSLPFLRLLFLFACGVVGETWDFRTDWLSR